MDAFVTNFCSVPVQMPKQYLSVLAIIHIQVALLATRSVRGLVVVLNYRRLEVYKFVLEPHHWSRKQGYCERESGFEKNTNLCFVHKYVSSVPAYMSMELVVS